MNNILFPQRNSARKGVIFKRVVYHNVPSTMLPIPSDQLYKLKMRLRNQVQIKLSKNKMLQSAQRIELR